MKTYTIHKQTGIETIIYIFYDYKYKLGKYNLMRKTEAVLTN